MIPRACTKNEHLPSELSGGYTWSKKIVPAMFRWLAAQDNPWALGSATLEAAIRLVGRHYAGEEYDLESGPSSPEVQLVTHNLFASLIPKYFVDDAAVCRHVEKPNKECCPLGSYQLLRIK